MSEQEDIDFRKSDRKKYKMEAMDCRQDVVVFFLLSFLHFSCLFDGDLIAHKTKELKT